MSSFTADRSYALQCDADDPLAGFPVLKRALPVAGAVLVLLLLILGIRAKRRG